ncbi:MAG TPA: hypothetical protein VMI54_16735 [Polyangiaceae bacterium]|nr:hypothetical protein [Polyangiaceae bacterium]
MVPFVLMLFAAAVATLLPGVAVAFAVRFWIGPARAADRLEALQSPSGLVLVSSPACE